MKSYSSRELIKILESQGWYCHKVRGNHWQFRHVSIPGKITIQHPVKDVAKFILQEITRKTGIKF